MKKITLNKVSKDKNINKIKNNNINIRDLKQKLKLKKNNNIGKSGFMAEYYTKEIAIFYQLYPAHS